MSEAPKASEVKSLRLHLGEVRSAWDTLAREVSQTHEAFGGFVGHTLLIRGKIARVVYVKDGQRFNQGSEQFFKPYIGNQLEPGSYRVAENRELSVVVTEPEELELNHEFELPYRELYVYDSVAKMQQDARNFQRAQEA